MSQPKLIGYAGGMRLETSYDRELGRQRKLSENRKVRAKAKAQIEREEYAALPFKEKAKRRFKNYAIKGRRARMTGRRIAGGLTSLTGGRRYSAVGGYNPWR